jgi:serine/threonine-protein kinase HipA
LLRIKTFLAAAHHFLRSRPAAVDAIARIETAIRDNWEKACGEAELSPFDKTICGVVNFSNRFPLSDDRC